MFDVFYVVSGTRTLKAVSHIDVLADAQGTNMVLRQTWITTEFHSLLLPGFILFIIITPTMTGKRKMGKGKANFLVICASRRASSAIVARNDPEHKDVLLLHDYVSNNICIIICLAAPKHAYLYRMYFP